MRKRIYMSDTPVEEYSSISGEEDVEEDYISSEGM